MNRKTPTSKFIFYVNKPKAKALANAFSEGCRRQNIECIVTEKMTPKPGFVGIFYGVVHETFPLFQYYRAEGRAVYLDNGWLSTRDYPTFRFTWNAVQAFLYDMEPVQTLKPFGPLPKLNRHPQRNLALLTLQTEAYFEYLRLPYKRKTWVRATTRLLESKGYQVEYREKPKRHDPKADNFFDQMARAGIVVSLNSAASLKALRWGIPAYCTLDCTLSPLAPVRLPRMGMAGAATRADVNDMCKRLARYEFDRNQLASGEFIHKVLAVTQEKRRGFFYAT